MPIVSRSGTTSVGRSEGALESVGLATRTCHFSGSVQRDSLSFSVILVLGRLRAIPAYPYPRNFDRCRDRFTAPAHNPRKVTCWGHQGGWWFASILLDAPG